MMLVTNKHLLLPVLVFMLCFHNHASAQEEAEIFTAKNMVFVEFLGNSGLYAAHYGRIFHQKERMKLSGSVGFSLVPRKGFEPFYPNFLSPVIPADFTVFWGKSRHNLELGTGFLMRQARTYRYDPEFSPTNLRKEVYWDKFVTMRIGYRYQKPEGGFFFRAGYTPILNFEGSEFAEKPFSLFPFNVGISMGKSF